MSRRKHRKIQNFFSSKQNRHKVTKPIAYKLQLTDSARLMARSLSNLVDNLPEGIHNIKCKYERPNKKCGTKHKDCECCLECVKDNLTEYKCLC